MKTKNLLSFLMSLMALSSLIFLMQCMQLDAPMKSMASRIESEQEEVAYLKDVVLDERKRKSSDVDRMRKQKNERHERYSFDFDQPKSEPEEKEKGKREGQKRDEIDQFEDHSVALNLQQNLQQNQQKSQPTSSSTGMPYPKKASSLPSAPPPPPQAQAMPAPAMPAPAMPAPAMPAPAMPITVMPAQEMKAKEPAPTEIELDDLSKSEASNTLALGETEGLIGGKGGLKESIQTKSQDIADGKPNPEKPRDKSIERAAEKPAERAAEKPATLGQDSFEDQWQSLMTNTQLQSILNQSKPETFWPRKAYFENQYLGGDPRYLHLKKQLPYALQSLLDQKPSKLSLSNIDLPQNEAIALSVQLSRNDFDTPQSMLMEIALQGSDRFGWRRPPIAWMLMVSPALIAEFFFQETGVEQLLTPFLNLLEPTDQIGFLIGNLEIPPMDIDALRLFLLKNESRLKDQAFSIYTPDVWTEKLEWAGGLLEKVASHPHRVPGTQGILLCLDHQADHAIDQIREKVQQLNERGIVTSVFVRNPEQSPVPFWQIAQAGHGNAYQMNDMSEFAVKIEEELKQNAKIIARLLRLNIRLGKNAQVIRILGTKRLDEEEIVRVKKREVAMDQALSKAFGVQANRGDDDDGLQVVIPYFYGKDQHLISVLLWVEGAGEVADVELKYKDLIKLENAQISKSVALSTQKTELNPLNLAVLENALQILDAELIEQASTYFQMGEYEMGLNLLRRLNQKDLSNQLDLQANALSEDFLDLLSQSKRGLSIYHP